MCRFCTRRHISRLRFVLVMRHSRASILSVVTSASLQIMFRRLSKYTYFVDKVADYGTQIALPQRSPRPSTSGFPYAIPALPLSLSFSTAASHARSSPFLCSSIRIAKTFLAPPPICTLCAFLPPNLFSRLFLSDALSAGFFVRPPPICHPCHHITSSRRASPPLLVPKK